MKRRSFVMLLLIVVLIGGAIGGAFIGGVAIGKSKGIQGSPGLLQGQLSQLTARNAQRSASQTTPTPQVPATPRSDSQNASSPQATEGPAAPPGGLGGAGFAGRGGAVGVVEKVEGNIITVTAARGPVRVVVAEATVIQKMAAGSLADLAQGQAVNVQGSQTSDGSIAATAISIVPAVLQAGSGQGAAGAAGGLGVLFSRGGTSGTVQKIEGNVLTVATAQGAVRVVIDGGTSIQKTGVGSLANVNPGQTVTVQGNQQSDGSVAATAMLIMPSGLNMPGANR